MKKLNLTEATILALEGKLAESKSMFGSQYSNNFKIESDYTAKFIGQNVAFEDIRELRLKDLSDEDKIKALKSLESGIDNDVKNRDGYDRIDKSCIPMWIDGYKSAINYHLDELSKKNKYYIRLKVDVSIDEDVNHMGSRINVDNGKIEKSDKFFDSEEEAEKAMKSVSKSEYEKFVEENYVNNYVDFYTWDVSVELYEPEVWVLR